MSTPARRVSKIVIVGRRLTKGDNGNGAYMARRRSEKELRTLMCNALIKWGRGFPIADAPPDINEWTRARARGRMGPMEEAASS